MCKVTFLFNLTYNTENRKIILLFNFMVYIVISLLFQNYVIIFSLQKKAVSHKIKHLYPPPPHTHSHDLWWRIILEGEGSINHYWKPKLNNNSIKVWFVDVLVYFFTHCIPSYILFELPREGKKKKNWLPPHFTTLPHTTSNQFRE